MDRRHEWATVTWVIKSLVRSGIRRASFSLRISLLASAPEPIVLHLVFCREKALSLSEIVFQRSGHPHSPMVPDDTVFELMMGGESISRAAHVLQEMCSWLVAAGLNEGRPGMAVFLRHGYSGLGQRNWRESVICLSG